MVEAVLVVTLVLGVVIIMVEETGLAGSSAASYFLRQSSTFQEEFDLSVTRMRLEKAVADAQ